MRVIKRKKERKKKKKQGKKRRERSKERKEKKEKKKERKNFSLLKVVPVLIRFFREGVIFHSSGRHIGTFEATYFLSYYLPFFLSLSGLGRSIAGVLNLCL